jgi:hypothetical protein
MCVNLVVKLLWELKKWHWLFEDSTLLCEGEDYVFSALRLQSLYGFSSTSVLGAIITTMAAGGVSHEPIQIYPNDNWGPQTLGFAWSRSGRMVKGIQMSCRVR